MTLHEAIVKILEEVGKPLSASDIARQVNEKQLYARADNQPVPSGQVHARVNEYPKLFFKEGGLIGLLIWKEKEQSGESSNQRKGSDLKDEIIEILKEKFKPLSVDELTQMVNKRGNYEQLDGSPIINRLVENKIRSYPQFFIFEKGLVSLIDWENLGDIRDLLFKEQKRLSTKEIADQINKSKSKDEEKLTPGQIFLRVRRYPNLFLIDGDEIELISEPSTEAAVETPIRKKEKSIGQILPRVQILKEIGVGNFKAFADKQNIKIKPITLIFGPNSSGKSSIIHSILYIQNAFATGELDPHYMQISGQSVDLGGFKQFVYKRRYQNRVVWSIKLSTENFSKRLKEILNNVNEINLEIEIGQGIQEKTKEIKDPDTNIYKSVPTGEFSTIGPPRVYKYEIQTDVGTFLQTSLKSNTRMTIDVMNVNHPAVQNIINAIIEANTLALIISDEDKNELNNATSKICSELFIEDQKFIPKYFQSSKTESSKDSIIISKVSKETRSEDLSKALELHFPRILNEILEGIYSSVEKTLGELIYLGPLRSYPERHIAFTKFNDPNWQAGGGLAWEIVRDNEEVREAVNEWLSNKTKLKTPYRLEIRKLVDTKSADLNKLLSGFKNFLLRDVDVNLDDVLKELIHSGDVSGADEETVRGKFSDYIDQYETDMMGLLDEFEGTDVLTDLVLIDQRNDTIVSHRDVGIGVSQVLPVLVYAYSNHNKLITIEQPEIHLHPSLQAELADVFIETALKNNNTYILETHSEHFILRIMRRIRESYENKTSDDKLKIGPEDIIVHFVEPYESKSIVRELKLNNRGEFVKSWPGGFFEEGFNELFL